MVLVFHVIFRNTCSKSHVTLGPLKGSQHSVMLCVRRHSVSGDSFVTWSCKTMWSVCHVSLLVGALISGSCLAKFGGCRYCVSGDIMFCGDIIWLKTKVTHAFTWICHYCLSLKYMAWKQTVYHVNKSDAGYTHLKEKKKKNTNNFCQSIPEGGGKGKTETKAIAKLLKCFVLNSLPAKFSTLQRALHDCL